MENMPDLNTYSLSDLKKMSQALSENITKLQYTYYPKPKNLTPRKPSHRRHTSHIDSNKDADFLDLLVSVHNAEQECESLSKKIDECDNENKAVELLKQKIKLTNELNRDIPNLFQQTKFEKSNVESSKPKTEPKKQQNVL